MDHISEGPDGTISFTFDGATDLKELKGKPVTIIYNKEEIYEYFNSNASLEEGNFGDYLIQKAYDDLYKARTGKTLTELGGAPVFEFWEDVFGEEIEIESLSIDAFLTKYGESQNIMKAVVPLSSEKGSRYYSVETKDGSQELVYHNHAYYLGRVNKDNCTVEIVNPHHTDKKKFIISFEELKDSFSRVEIAYLKEDEPLIEEGVRKKSD